MTSSTKPRGPVSIVIPAFNEEESIQSSIREVAAAMEPSGVEYELIVVDDGSADATAERASAEGARLVRLPENRGYGAALKAGIAQAAHDVIVITDQVLRDRLSTSHGRVEDSPGACVLVSAADHPYNRLLQPPEGPFAGRALLFVIGVGKFTYDVYMGDMGESALPGVFSALALWSVGLLSDQVSKMAMRNDGF